MGDVNVTVVLLEEDILSYLISVAFLASNDTYVRSYKPVYEVIP